MPMPEYLQGSALEEQFTVGLRDGHVEMDFIVDSQVADAMMDALATTAEYYGDKLDGSDLLTESKRFDYMLKLRIAGSLATRLRGREPYKESDELRKLRDGILGKAALADESTPSAYDAKRQPPRTSQAVLRDSDVDFVFTALTNAPDILFAKAFELNNSGPPPVQRQEGELAKDFEQRAAQVKASWEEQMVQLRERATIMNQITEIAGAAGLPEDHGAPTNINPELI